MRRRNNCRQRQTKASELWLGRERNWLDVTRIEEMWRTWEMCNFNPLISTLEPKGSPTSRCVTFLCWVPLKAGRLEAAATKQQNGFLMILQQCGSVKFTKMLNLECSLIPTNERWRWTIKSLPVFLLSVCIFPKYLVNNWMNFNRILLENMIGCTSTD